MQGASGPRPLPVPRPSGFPTPPQMMMMQPRLAGGITAGPRGYGGCLPPASQLAEARPGQPQALPPSAVGAGMPATAPQARPSGPGDVGSAASPSMPRPGALAGAQGHAHASKLNDRQGLRCLDSVHQMAAWLCAVELRTSARPEEPAAIPRAMVCGAVGTGPVPSLCAACNNTIIDVRACRTPPALRCRCRAMRGCLRLLQPQSSRPAARAEPSGALNVAAGTLPPAGTVPMLGPLPE